MHWLYRVIVEALDSSNASYIELSNKMDAPKVTHMEEEGKHKIFTPYNYSS